jgi:hypothetical protein
MFIFYEQSTLGYAKDLIPAWADFLNSIPSKNLETFDIKNKMVEDLDQNQLTTQFESPNSSLLAHGVARLARLEFLTIHHLVFDSTLLKILPSLHQLRRLKLHINMDMTDKNVIGELCHNLENCNRLESFTIYVPAEKATLLGDIFVSLAKLQRFIEIDLHFNSLEKIPAEECFEKLGLIENLQHVNLCIKKREIHGTNNSDEADEELKKKIVKFVPKQCKFDFYFTYDLKP